MIYIIKKCVAVLAAPLAFALLLALAAAMFRVFGRRRVAIWVLSVAGAIAYLGASGIVGDTLLGRLERRYVPLTDESLPDVGYIVVLGSDYAPRDGISVTAALDEDGLVRIVEGIRLARRLFHSKLVVSGGSSREEPPSVGYAKLARDLGIDDAVLLELDGALNTGEEARSVAALIGAAPFILVTSAYHMPRAMRLMERAGARPIAAPAGQRVNQSSRGYWRRFLPTSGGLRNSERALHEYLGLAALTFGVES